MFDVQVLDKHIEFLRNQAGRCRDVQGKPYWAQQNAKRFEEIAEVLRQLRQDQQMAGVGGKRIE